MQETIPSNYVRVVMTPMQGKATYVEDVALALHAEGKIANLPVLLLEDDDILIYYTPVQDIASLIAVPSREQLVNNMQMDTDFDSVEQATTNLIQEIPNVPLMGGVDVDE